MLEKLTRLFRLDDDSADEREVVDSIVQGVTFRGAKLWILIIAVFVASLGLNINSAAVIIGAMLISPLMGPIIGMGLAVGTYDFPLLRRSVRNFVVATLFSILTATFYFLITPFAEAQSELLARTSPTIYDVLIALCGGLAGIIALSSRSQRTGNVIPGVAIATALMPPLCTVGFGIATANWAYATGALYLFLINTIFIAFATLIGTVFIMKFKKKAFVDPARKKKVLWIIYSVVILTMLPAVILTMGMLRENYFNNNVSRFIRYELHFPSTRVISYNTDFGERSFSVVLYGQEIDSMTLSTVKNRLPLYQLKDVKMSVFQGEQAHALSTDNTSHLNANNAVSQMQVMYAEQQEQLKQFTEISDNATTLLKEAQVLFPQVSSMTTARGQTAISDTAFARTIICVDHTGMPESSQEQLKAWLKQRLAQPDAQIVLQHQP